MDWIESLGGPLILMEESLLPFWEGANPPDPGRQVRADSRASFVSVATDYDRACDVKRALGVLEVGPGVALVLGGECLPAAWQPFTSESGGLIVRWMYGESDESVAKHLLAIPSELFDGPALEIEVSVPLVLFDSVMPGHEITTAYLTLDVGPARYAVRTALYQPDQHTSLLVHQFLRVGELH